LRPDHSPSTACKHTVSGSISLPSQGFFSPFPHGTSSLSVANEYLALESGLPSFPRDYTCPVVLRIPLRVRSSFGYMAITFCGPAFQRVHLKVGLVTLLTRSYNPPVQAQRFGLFRFRSPLLSESRLIYFPPGTEMVHFPGLARTRLYIQRAVTRVHRVGFPHSDISGSKPACGSPKLFAACHVLHRLLAPRHPPYALSSLTIKLTQHVLASRDGKSAKIVRRHSHCSTRAELAATHGPEHRDDVFASLFSCQRTVLPIPSGRPSNFLADNKKPGVERRAPSPHDGEETRCSTTFYPVFVSNLTP
jgi:hypothetical protein